MNEGTTLRTMITEQKSDRSTSMMPIARILRTRSADSARVLLLALCGLVRTSQGLAQENSSCLQIAPVHFESVFKGDGFAPVALRVAYERLMHQDMMFGVDAHILYRSIFGLAPISNDEALTYNGWTAGYQKNLREWGLTYRTGYYFTGDNELGICIGTSIGFRRIVREITVNDAYNPNVWGTGASPFRSTYVAEKTVFPVGLRLGLRGAYLYGVESDLYFGVSYQLGGGKRLSTEPELVDAPLTLAPITYTMGFAWNIPL